MKIYSVIFTCLLMAFASFDAQAQSQEDIEKMMSGEQTEELNEETIATVDSTITEVNKGKKKAKDKVGNTKELEDEWSNLSFKKTLKIGDALFEEGSFYNASEYYKSALSKTSKKKKLLYLYYQLGESNFFMRDYNQARTYYEKTMSADAKNKYLTSGYQLANTYKHMALYDTAKQTYQAFISLADDNPKVAFEKKRARLEMKGCDYADTMSIDEPMFEVFNPGENINGPFSDFGPTLLNDQMVFSKINADHAIEMHEEMIEDHYARLYAANEGEEATVFANSLNSKGEFVGNPSFSADGSTLYFTKCSLDKSMNSVCSIYKSEKSGSTWSDAVKLGNAINEGSSNTTHPHITVDEDGTEILYFIAEREKGRGGKDIWYSTMLEDGSFDRAKNLGYPINTRYDELSPFYDANSRTLYFSSNGHISIGGFDVFKSVKDEDGDWTEEVNMGVPVNSSLDDYDFELNTNSDQGVLVSNRIGTTSLRSATCCDDIFMVIPATIEIYVSGLVYAANANSREIVSEADVVLISDDDLEKVVFDGTPFLFVLEKDKEYTLTAKNETFERVELSFNTSGISKSDTLNYDLILTDRKIENFVLGTIYYEFDFAKLREDAPDTLRKVLAFMSSYPKTILEVGAHTDSKGTDAYNEKLSQKRAEAAYNYLISEGISEERLEIKWYGESQPAAPNTNNDGSDNEAGRALNRRTEFKVIGQLK